MHSQSKGHTPSDRTTWAEDLHGSAGDVPPNKGQEELENILVCHFFGSGLDLFDPQGGEVKNPSIFRLC